MKIKNVYYTSRFKRRIKKYKHKQKTITRKIRLLQKNPFSPTLKTHKLTGKLANYWAFSIESNLRIMFAFIDEETAVFIDIDTHDIYR